MKMNGKCEKQKNYKNYKILEGKWFLMENNINVHRIIIVQNNKTLEGGAQMEVTEVRIRKLNPEGKTKAIAQITFDNEFVVHEVRVREGKDGLVMSMPRKERNGKFYDIAHPINQATRDKIEKAVLEAYDKAEDPAPVADEADGQAE